MKVYMKKIGTILALALSFNLYAAESKAAAPIGEFVWNELATTNIQAAKDFYGNVFGWEFVDKNVGDMTYTIIKKDKKELGGIWAIPTQQQDQIPPHWLAYILVENLEQSLVKAREKGATIIKNVQKVGDMGSFAVVKDPSGAHFALWESR
jgi:predicted enzyme related to lactoylglutathione lyase